MSKKSANVELNEIELNEVELNEFSEIEQLIENSETYDDLSNEDKIEFLTENSISYKLAKSYVTLNKKQVRRIDYKRLVEIYRNETNKVIATKRAYDENICTIATARHLWSAIKFAKEYSRQDQLERETQMSESDK